MPSLTAKEKTAQTMQPEQQRSTMPLPIIAVCGAAIAFDGYDLVVYGATLPALRDLWTLSPETSGLLGALPLLGMLIGALCVGNATARWGRKRVFLISLLGFSALTACCAFAPTPTIFGALRFLGGLGLGAIMPVAATLTTDSAPRNCQHLAYVIMQSGYPLGGVLASLTALSLIPLAGWQVMYLIAAAPILLVVPPAWRLLPEPRDELQAQAIAQAPTAASTTAGLRTLLASTHRAQTLLFWAMSFCSLLFVYGINTWLPTLMLDSGHVLQSALSFLLAFNAGAITGGIIGGWAADRWQPRTVVTLSFIIGAVAVAALTFVTSEVFLLMVAALAGYGAVGTQTLINGWVTRSYPVHVRTTGIGWSLGVGRLGAISGPLITGAVLTATGGGAAAFLTFAGVGAIGSVFALTNTQARLPITHETDATTRRSPKKSQEQPAH